MKLQKALIFSHHYPGCVSELMGMVGLLEFINPKDLTQLKAAAPHPPKDPPRKHTGLAEPAKHQHPCTLPSPSTLAVLLPAVSPLVLTLPCPRIRIIIVPCGLLDCLTRTPWL